MEQGTIIYALFESRKGMHDRMTLLPGKPTVSEVWEWLLQKRALVEAENGAAALISWKVYSQSDSEKKVATEHAEALDKVFEEVLDRATR